MIDPQEHKIALLEQRVEELYSIVERLSIRLRSIEKGGWAILLSPSNTDLKPKSDDFGYPQSHE